jgi:hypothetical protein
MISSLDAARVRSWLQVNAFPAAPPAPKLTARRAAILVAAFIALVIVQLARLWSSHPLNSLWGEDGFIFLKDAMQKGFWTTVTTPYNGYLQVSSRIVAEPVSHLPVDWFAPAMAVSGAVIVSAYVFVIWRASAAHIQTTYLRVTLAALVVLLPIVGVETLDNVVNTIWFLFFLSFWILLWRPATNTGASGAALLLFLAAVSNGGTLILLPLWLLRVFAVRDRRDGILAAGFALGVTMQLALSWQDLNKLGEAGDYVSSTTACQLTKSCGAGTVHWSLIPAYLQRVVGGTVTGQTVGGYLWVHLGTAIEVIFAAGLVVFIVAALRSGSARVRFFVPLTILASVAIFLASGGLRWSSAGLYFEWPQGVYNTGESHYLVVPTLLLVSGILVFLDDQPHSVSTANWSRIRLSGSIFLVLIALTSFAAGDQAVRGIPSWSGQLESARLRCVSTAAPNVNVKIDPSIGFVATTIPLPCARLVRLPGEPQIHTPK